MTLISYALITTAMLLFFVLAAACLVGTEVLETVHEENARRFRQLKRYLAMHLLRAFLFGLPLAIFGGFVVPIERPPLTVGIWFISLLVLWWMVLMLGLVFLAWKLLNVLWGGHRAP